MKPWLGALRPYLLPGIVFQSVLMGGGYMSGREAIEYGVMSAHGPLTLLAVAAGFFLMMFSAAEVCRKHRVFSYDAVGHLIIGRAAPLLELTFLAMLLLVVAVVCAAATNVVSGLTGWGDWVSRGLLFLLVVGVIQLGRVGLEVFESAGTILMYLGLAALLALAIRGGIPLQSCGPGEGANWARLAVTYVGYNSVVLFACFFTFDSLTSRTQSLIASLVSACLGVLPMLALYLIFCGSSLNLISRDVPVYDLLASVAGPRALTAYSLLLLLTLVETTSGLLHALNHRLSSTWPGIFSRSLVRSALTLAFLLGAWILSQVGVVSLVARGYSTMAWAFGMLLVLPLIGKWLFGTGLAVKRSEVPNGDAKP